MPIGLISKVFLLTILLFSCKSNYHFTKKEIRRDSFKITSSFYKNMYRVNEEIYRSEQPESSSNEELKKLGIKTILNLRDDKSDSLIFLNSDFNLINVKMDARRFKSKDVIKALEALKSAPKPILIHCKHGSDRTGLIVALYRITEENWPKEKAIFEMKRGGFGFHDKYQNIPRYIKRTNNDKPDTK